jgi:hypothetical protein
MLNLDDIWYIHDWQIAIIYMLCPVPITFSSPKEPKSIRGSENAVDAVLKFASNAKTEIDACLDYSQH